MRVSVIIPLFNKIRYIERALHSIAAQTISDFEAIIVDDGSTDGGDQLAARYPDPRFRLIRQSNAGPGAARNRGVAEARASYVAFLDADDAWRPEFLETNLRLLDANPSVMSVSGAAIEYPSGIPSGPRWTSRGITEGIHTVSPSTPLHILDTMVSFMGPPMTIIRADALRRSGGFEGAGCRFGEDGALWLKLLLNGSVYLHLLSLTEVHREASALSGNYARQRPVEPYLSDPDALRHACPPALQPLLERFYAGRACKTACMLAYWGDWRRARRLLRQFVSLRDWRVPLFGMAFAAATPVGALGGRFYRWSRGRSRTSSGEPPSTVGRTANASR
jgi:GT2 family glycosyltransferase